MQSLCFMCEFGYRFKFAVSKLSATSSSFCSSSFERFICLWNSLLKNMRRTYPSIKSPLWSDKRFNRKIALNHGTTLELRNNFMFLLRKRNSDCGIEYLISLLCRLGYLFIFFFSIYMQGGDLSEYWSRIFVRACAEIEAGAILTWRLHLQERWWMVLLYF